MSVNAKCPNCGCMFGTNDAKLEFERLYINAKELSEISGMTYNECLKVIDQCRTIMKENIIYQKVNLEWLYLELLVNI